MPGRGYGTRAGIFYILRQKLDDQTPAKCYETIIIKTGKSAAADKPIRQHDHYHYTAREWEHADTVAGGWCRVLCVVPMSVASSQNCWNNFTFLVSATAWRLGEVQSADFYCNYLQCFNSVLTPRPSFVAYDVCS